MDKKLKKQLLKWLIENRDVLNLFGIERRLEIPNRYLYRWIVSNRDLPDMYAEKLIEFAMQWDFKPTV